MAEAQGLSTVFLWDMVMQTNQLLSRLRQEDCKLKAWLGYSVGWEM